VVKNVSSRVPEQEFLATWSILLKVKRACQIKVLLQLGFLFKLDTRSGSFGRWREFALLLHIHVHLIRDHSNH
jgi:hypothetical protein